MSFVCNYAQLLFVPFFLLWLLNVVSLLSRSKAPTWDEVSSLPLTSKFLKWATKVLGSEEWCGGMERERGESTGWGITLKSQASCLLKAIKVLYVASLDRSEKGAFPSWQLLHCWQPRQQSHVARSLARPMSRPLTWGQPLVEPLNFRSSRSGIVWSLSKPESVLQRQSSAITQALFSCTAVYFTKAFVSWYHVGHLDNNGELHVPLWWRHSPIFAAPFCGKRSTVNSLDGFKHWPKRQVILCADYLTSDNNKCCHK